MRKFEVKKFALNTLVLLLTGCLLLTVAGCGGSDEKDPVEPTPTAQTQKQEGPSMQAYLSDPVVIGALEELRDGMTELSTALSQDGGAYVYTEAGGAATKEILTRIEGACNTFINYPMDPSAEAYPAHEKLVQAAQSYLKAKENIIISIDNTDADAMLAASDALAEGATLTTEATTFMTQ